MSSIETATRQSCLIHADVPAEIVDLLADRGVEADFARLDPDVQRNFAQWVATARSAGVRDRRLGMIIEALAGIRGEGRTA